MGAIKQSGYTINRMIVNTRSEELRFRKADIMDLMRVYTWRNQQEIVKQSRTGQKVSLKEHKEWFKKAINSDQVVMMIIENEWTAIGQLRFDNIKAKIWEMSIYLEESEVGRGRGEYLIKAGCRELIKEDAMVTKIVAQIRFENIRSIKAFKKAGFEEIPQSIDCNQSEMVKLIYKLEVD